MSMHVPLELDHVCKNFKILNHSAECADLCLELNFIQIS